MLTHSQNTDRQTIRLAIVHVLKQQFSFAIDEQSHISHLVRKHLAMGSAIIQQSVTPTFSRLARTTPIFELNLNFDLSSRNNTSCHNIFTAGCNTFTFFCCLFHVPQNITFAALSSPKKKCYIFCNGRRRCGYMSLNTHMTLKDDAK